MNTEPPRAPVRRHGWSRPARAFILLLATAAAVAVLVRCALDRMIDAARQKLQSEMNVEASYASSRLYLGGIALRDVRVALAPDPATHRSRRIITADRVDLCPSLRGVLDGSRGFPWTLTAVLYAGTVRLAVDSRQDAWEARIYWTNIDIRGPAVLLDAAGISGSTNGRLLLTARENERGPRLAGGSWDIAARRLELAPFHRSDLALPPIVVSDLHTTGSWAGRHVAVTSLDASGSFGTAGLAGKIVIRTPLEKSALSMRLTHTWPAEIDPDLAILVRMLLGSGATERPAQYRVTGTVAAPAISPTAPP